MTRLDVPALGIGFALAASLLGASQDALVKWLVAEHSLVQLLFLRSIVMLAVIAPLIAWRHGRGGFRTHHAFGQVLRVAANVTAFLAFYYSLTVLPLADATAIALSAPLFMVVLSGPLLGERVGPRRAVAVAVGFAGVVLMMQPGAAAHGDWTGRAAALSAALLYALWMVLTRRLSVGDSSETQVFYGALGFFLVGACVVPFTWVAPAPGDLGPVLVIGLTGIAVHYMLAQAYRHAPVYTVAPFEYTVLVWAALFGYLVWGEVPGAGVLAGALIVVGSGLFVLHRERRRARAVTLPARP